MARFSLPPVSKYMATQISFWEKKQIGFSLLRDFFSVKIKMREFFYLGLVRRVLVGLV